MMTQNPTDSSESTLFRFARYVYRYKTRLFTALFCSVLIILLNLVFIALLKPATESIFLNQTLMSTVESSDDSDTVNEIVPDKIKQLIWPVYRMIDGYVAEGNQLAVLVIICLCMAGVTLLTGVARFIFEYLIQWIGNRTVLDLQRDLFTKMTSYHATYFSKHKVGFLISYFTVDTRVIGTTVFNVFGRLILDPLSIIGFICYMFYLQWKLTLLYAIIFPFILFSIQFFAKKSRKAGRKSQEITATMGAFLHEHLSFIRLVQGYGMYDRQKNIFWRESRGVFDAMMSLAKSMAMSSPISTFLGVLAACCIIMLGGYMIYPPSGGIPEFSASTFVSYLAALAMIYQPVKRMERTIQQVQQGLAAAERVFSALDANETLPKNPQAIELTQFQSEVCFDHVSFSYDTDIVVLNDVSFTAKKGEQIALVGPSGAGKTTLVNLLPRFYDPDSGAVLLDGHDLRDLQVDTLRQMISYVHQDVMILGASVKENITCGDDSYSEQEMIQAAQAASAHEFIDALPNGYNTIVGERGESLSGGQCQRLAIARAFLRNTPILILDEATSSLDSESEQRIKQSLQKLMQGRTSFVIAHRLSTILQSDKIIVFENGSIVDIGKHNELLSRCALYQKLYNIQFSDDKKELSTSAPV
jgi:subfamily B ATP-binding cassette protein MsbA